MHNQIWSFRTAMGRAPDLLQIELRHRFNSLQQETQNDVLEWLQDKLAGIVSDYLGIDDEWHRREWLHDNEISTAQQVSANLQTRTALEMHLGEIEAEIGTTEGCIERCPEEVPSTGTTEGCPADGEGFESCSDENAPDHS